MIAFLLWINTLWTSAGGADSGVVGWPIRKMYE
jgi:hypothetical protein